MLHISICVSVSFLPLFSFLHPRYRDFFRVTIFIPDCRRLMLNTTKIPTNIIRETRSENVESWEFVWIKSETEKVYIYILNSMVDDGDSIPKDSRTTSNVFSMYIMVLLERWIKKHRRRIELRWWCYWWWWWWWWWEGSVVILIPILTLYNVHPYRYIYFFVPKTQTNTTFFLSVGCNKMIFLVSVAHTKYISPHPPGHSG